MLGGNSAVEPPESMPNSEVKRSSADGSVGFPHVRVGHRQAPNTKPDSNESGFFTSVENLILLLSFDRLVILIMAFSNMLIF